MSAIISDIFSLLGNIISFIAVGVHYFIIITIVLVGVVEIADAVIDRKRERDERK